MPDGGAGLGAQQEGAREGMIARASEKLQKFREAIQALFKKEGSDKINKKDRSKVDEILAIAEADAIRVQKETEPLEKILEEARAGLAGVTLKEDLNEAVEGLKKEKRDAIENALRAYREALVEVLKESEAPISKQEGVSGEGAGAAAPSEAPIGTATDAPPKEKRPARPKKEGESEPWIDDFISSISRDFKDDEDLTREILAWEKPAQHLAEYDKLVRMAMEAEYQRENFSAKNAELYEQSMKNIKTAMEEYKALKEVPTLARNASVAEAKKDGVDGMADDILIETIMDATNPSREDLKGPFERMMLLATQADALSRRIKTETEKQPEYAAKMEELRIAYKTYQALEQAAPLKVANGLPEDDVPEERITASKKPSNDPPVDLAELLRRSGPTVKREPQRPDPSLNTDASGSVKVSADVAARLKAEAEARVEARAETESKKVMDLIEKLKKDKKADVMALASLFKGSEVGQPDFEKLVDEDLRVYVARWLVEFMDGRYEMVRLPADEAWEEVRDADGNVSQAMRANEANKDEYKKTTVAESSYALAAVVKAGASFGFKDEAEIRATASEDLPSEAKGGLGSFVMDASKASGKERQREQLQGMMREIESIKERLGKHALNLVRLTEEEVHALEARRDELGASRMKLMEDIIGKGFKDQPSSPPPVGGRVDALNPLPESLRDNEDRLKIFKKAIANWKDTTEIDGVIGGWVTWLEAVIEVQKALSQAATTEERAKYMSAAEVAIAARPSAKDAKKIQEWLHAQRGLGQQEYIQSVVEPRADAFALVSGFKAQKLSELVQAEKESISASKDSHDDDPIITIEDEDLSDVSAPEVTPATPPAPLVESIRTGIDRNELKARTEAARGMLDSIHANIATWARGKDSVGQEYYIKDAVAHVELILRLDEDFLAIATPLESEVAAYTQKREATIARGDLTREFNRLFTVLPGQKRAYINDIEDWIKKSKQRAQEAKAKKNPDTVMAEEKRTKELQKRKDVIDALKPFFEVWLKMEAQPVAAPTAEVVPPVTTPETTPLDPPDAAPAPSDPAPTTAPDATAPAPPSTPPTPDIKPLVPPTPDKPPARPEPGFANESLFSRADRETILSWIQAQQPRVDRAKKLAADKDLREAQKRYEPFAQNLKRLDSILEATTQLTRATTEQERLDREAALMRLREEGVVLGAETALAEMKAERAFLKGDDEYFENNTPYSQRFKQSKGEIKDRLKQLEDEIALAELNVELERALMEAVVVKTTYEKPDTFKAEIAADEARIQQKDTNWKDTLDLASQAHEKLCEHMETRKQNTEAEPYFGAIFQAFVREQEATIGLNKALRRFDILDKTELQVTQALRLLDVAPSGPVAPTLWNDLPNAAKLVLKRAGEGQDSTAENMKARLYEVLRGLTNDKVKANKELQEQLEMVNGLKEQSAFALAQKTYHKLQDEQQQVMQEMRRLTSDINTYNPLNVSKMADKKFYVVKLQESNTRLALAKNRQRYVTALLKDSETLLNASLRTIWGQHQNGRQEGMLDQASAHEALKSQQEVTEAIIQVINGQAQLGRMRDVEQEQEAEWIQTLPKNPTNILGGGASFGTGTRAPENRTSGGGGKEEESAWASFKKTGFYKGAADLIGAFKFWE